MTKPQSLVLGQEGLTTALRDPGRQADTLQCDPLGMMVTVALQELVRQTHQEPSLTSLSKMKAGGLELGLACLLSQHLKVLPALGNHIL